MIAEPGPVLMRRLVACATVVATIGVVGSGCSVAGSAPEATPPSGPPASVASHGDTVTNLPPWKERLEAALDPAAPGIASEARDILRPSLVTGMVTRAQVDAAADNAAACLEDAGFGSTMHRPESDYEGYTIDVHFSAGRDLSPDQVSDLERVIDACLDEHFYAVEEFYLLHPSAVEAQESAELQRFEEYKLALFECLSLTVHAVDDDATRTEFAEAAAQDLLERGESSCYVTTGYLTGPE